MTTPIFISPPAKVKKLGVITKIITAMFADNGLEVNIDENAYAQSFVEQKIKADGSTEKMYDGADAALTTEDALVVTSYQDYDIEVLDGVARLSKSGVVGKDKWTGWFIAQIGVFEPGITQLKLQRSNNLEISFTIDSIDTTDETRLILQSPDPETLPADTIITGPGGDKTFVDFIIDPLRFDPRTVQDSSSNPRLLILNDIGNPNNAEGATAWKNEDNTDFVAGQNDIIEWDGFTWHVVFDASEETNETYVTNINTQTQYKWTGDYWILSYEGEYPNGTWRVVY